MQNINSNSNNYSSLFSSTNYENKLLNTRRSSLGNMNSYDESAFVQFNIDNMNRFKSPSFPVSPVYPMDSNLQNDNQDNGNLSDEMFSEKDRFNFNSELANSSYNNNISSPGLSNSFLLSQVLLQQRNQQQQESLLTYNKNMVNSSSSQSNAANFIYPPSLTPHSAFSPVTSKANLRRRSYHFGQINSLLQPVQESCSFSPINLQQLKYQQQQKEVESRINKLIGSTQYNNQTQDILNSSLIAEQNSLLNMNQQSFNMPAKQRMRAFSIGGGSLDNSSMSSFLSDFSQSNADSSILNVNNINQSKSLSNLNATANTSFLNFRKLDSFEEKLATSGNIFQKRVDWSIINKLPINKQNTIHMRLEDEGPFGNDEIRCFVLSHLSSLNIKELKCIFCDCDLIIYDRFPLIDGTLFISPYNYDPVKAISTHLPKNKNLLEQPCKQTDLLKQKEKEEYIYSICLKCMMKEKDHDIKCKNCKISWQDNGGKNLQIGTLYKYDIFAAFPCCQQRLNCSNCENSIMNIDSGHLQYFSSYSEERTCGFCKTKAYHFIKPLKNIFFASSCHKENNHVFENRQESDSFQNDLFITSKSFEKCEIIDNNFSS